MTKMVSGQNKSDGTFLLLRWVFMINQLSSKRFLKRRTRISWLISVTLKELHRCFTLWPMIQTTMLIISIALLVSHQYMNSILSRKLWYLRMMYGSNSLKPSMPHFLEALRSLEFTLSAVKDSSTSINLSANTWESRLVNPMSTWITHSLLQPPSNLKCIMCKMRSRVTSRSMSISKIIPLTHLSKSPILWIYLPSTLSLSP